MDIEALEAHDLELTFDEKNKIKGVPHVMELEEVPALTIGASPSKIEKADAPTIISSAQGTPTKGNPGVSGPAVS